MYHQLALCHSTVPVALHTVVSVHVCKAIWVWTPLRDAILIRWWHRYCFQLWVAFCVWKWCHYVASCLWAGPIALRCHGLVSAYWSFLSMVVMFLVQCASHCFYLCLCGGCSKFWSSWCIRCSLCIHFLLWCSCIVSMMWWCTSLCTFLGASYFLVVSLLLFSLCALV